MRIPPLRLCEAGDYNDTLIQLLRLNMRIPDTFMGDLQRAGRGVQRSAGGGSSRAGAGARKRAAGGASSRCCIDRSEQLTRRALRALPEGT